MFISGVVFGIVEGIEYVAKPIDLPTGDHPQALAADVPEVAAHMFALGERMLFEMMHPWLTASVAAVAWLCAWRTGVFFSRATIAAFVFAVAARAFGQPLDRIDYGRLLMSEYRPPHTWLSRIACWIGG